MKIPPFSPLTQNFFSPAVLTFLAMSLVGFASVYALGYLTGQLLRRELLNAPVGSAQVRVPEKLPLPQDVARKKEEFAGILERNIFQAQRQKKPLRPLIPPSDLRVSGLQLELKGTMVGKTPKESYAFLASVVSGQQKVFGVGECFRVQGLKAEQGCSPESVKLTQILNRQVALLHQNKEEWLLMNPPAPTILEMESFENLPNPEAVAVQPKSNKKRNSPQLLPKNQPVIVSVQQAAQPRPSPVSSGQDTFHLQREWVDEQLANFAKILQDARVIPISLDQQTFFQFAHIKKGSMYETLGLQNKDVILSINDTVIDNLPKAMGLLQKLQSEREIALVIKREEGEKTLRYYIN